MKKKLQIFLTMLFFIVLSPLLGRGQSGLCDPETPFFEVDLSADPEATWTSDPPMPRDGYCCTATGNDKCMEFEITLNEGAAQINFQIASGAVPPGAMYYQIDCGPLIEVGNPICLDGQGPYTLTFCKPGNNQNTYSVTSIPAPAVSPDDTTGATCSLPVGTIGIELVGITWTTVYPGNPGDYDSYLSCTSGCDSTIVQPTDANPPSSIGIQICGTPIAADCYPVGFTYCDTIEVTFIPPVIPTIGPDPAEFCVGSSILLTGGFTGGLPPYNYVWRDPLGSVISTATSATATNAGTYTFEVQDQYYPACPSVSTTLNVTTIPLPVVNAGPNFVICPTSPTVNLSGSIINSSGGLWSGGGGSFFPSASSLSATYVPTQAEIDAGSFYVYLTANAVSDCPPVVDSMLVTVTSPVLASVNGPGIVCYGEEGEIFGIGAGGTAPYTYSWSTSESTQNITVPAGSYTVTVTDATTYPCSASFTYLLDENPLIDIVVPSAPIITCDSFATVSISATGGAGNYTYVWSNGLSGSNVTVNTGIYQVTAYDNLGCSVIEQVSVTASNSALFVYVPAPDTVCFGGSTSFTPVVTGGYPPYTYNWTSGDLTQTSSGSAGSYCVTVKDTLNCIYTACVQVIEDPLLTVTITDPPIICDGDVTDLVAVASGGNPPYQYQWDTGVFNDSIIGGDGTYVVNVFDSNIHNCTATASGTITEASPLAVSFSSINVSCYSGSNGSAIATAAGSIAPYSYSWSNGALGNSLQGIIADTYYNVTIVDNIGCVLIDSIFVNEPTPVMVNITDSTMVSCFGGSDGTISGVASGGTPGYSYSWYRSPNNIPIGQTTPQATGLLPGQYYLFVTDANGCTGQSAIVTIVQPTPLNATLTTVNALCYDICNGSIQADASGSNGGYTYLWNDPLSQTGVTASNLCDGTYSVTINDSKGCQAIFSSTVGQPTPLVIDSTIVNANCFQADGSGCVLVSGGTSPYTYLWPNGNLNSCQSNLYAGSYTVKVTDINGCIEYVSLNIQNTAGPVAGIITQSAVSCNSGCNGSATVGVVGGTIGPFTSQWDANAANQITPTASNLCAGVYGVTITDTNGCTSAISVVISQPNPIVLNLSSENPLCNGDCNGSATSVVIGGTPSYSFQWYNSATGTMISNNDTVTSLCSGNYSLLITDANGCTKTDNFLLTDPPMVGATHIVQDAFCNGACDGQITITPTSGTAPYTYEWSDPNNQTTQTATELCPGAYSYTVSDYYGCDFSAIANIGEPTVLTGLFTNFSNVSCFGVCDGYVESSAIGGTPPYTYSWSNGMTGPTIQGLCAGTYCITITDANGCVFSDCISITQPTSLQTNMTTSMVTCFGACNGEALATPTGGTGPYSFQWNAPGAPTNAYINGLCPGVYEVVVTDANNCSLNKFISITQPNPIVLSVQSFDDANCGQSNGEICLGISGGTGTPTIQWLDPMLQTTNCASGLPAGCYQVIVTDINACSADTTLCINNVSGPSISFNSSSNISCFGGSNGSIAVAVSGSTPPIAISWFDGNNVAMPSLAGQQIASGLGAGCYTVIAVDGANCSTNLTECVSEPLELYTAILSNTGVTCKNACDGTAVSTVGGGTAPYTYSWSGGSAPTSASNYDLCGGPTFLTVTDGMGCQANTSIEIYEPESILVGSSTINDVLCSGACTGYINVIMQGGTPPYSYVWASSVGSGPTATNLCASSYTLTVQDINSCDTTMTWIIAEPDPLVLVASGTNSTCSDCNGSGSVNTTGGQTPYTFSWQSGQITPTVSGELCAGTHQITVTDGNGCVESETITISNEPAPIIDDISILLPLCFSGNTGEATVTASGGATFGAYDYLWSPSANNQTTQTAISLVSGMHCVTVTDVNNCPVSACEMIGQPQPLLPVPDGADLICFGRETNIWGSGQGGTQPYSINWLTNPPLSGVGPHTVSPEETTQYCFNVEDANGCASANACVLVEVKPELDIVIGQGQTICIGDSAQISAQFSGGEGSGYTLTWFKQFLYGPLVASVEAGNSSSAMVKPIDSTWYFVLLEDGCSNPVYDSVLIGVVENSPVSIEVSAIGCSPLTVDVVVTSNDAVVYNYDFDCDGVYDLNTNDSIGTYVYTADGNYDVCVMVINQYGCQLTTTQLNAVTVWPTPNANFQTKPAIASIYSPSILFNDLSQDNEMNVWTFGDGDTIEGAPELDITNQATDSTFGSYSNVTHIYGEPGEYPVSLVTSNVWGCRDTAYFDVIIEEEYSIYVPNCITPDGDGVNDVFYVRGTGFVPEDFKLYIFDRWGLLIFESYFPNIGWDGTYKEKLVQQDVYVWKVFSTNLKGEKFEEIGHVSVLR